MRCLSCHKLSFSTFCKKCKEELLKPSISKRYIDGLEVYSFYKYHNIEDFLLTKHTPQGFRIYSELAKITFKPFIREFMKNSNKSIYIIGVDESVDSGYSHVALLTHQMRYKRVKVLHNSLIAKNRVNYSGKSLQFRLENPRGFIYRGIENIDVILVDDIITTGITLKEAKKILGKSRVNSLFALTLASLV